MLLLGVHAEVACGADPFEEHIHRLQLGPLGRHETENDGLVVGNVPKRIKAAPALRRTGIEALISMAQFNGCE